MLKNKRILLILILATTLLLIPSIVNAVEATETTKTSTGVEVKWKYTLNSDNEIITLYCSNKSQVTGNLTIPSTIDGHKIKSIGYFEYRSYNYEGTFEGCTGLNSVTISDGIEEIGRGCFFNCVGLTNVSIPNSVLVLGMNAFYGCSGLKTITIPNKVYSIGNGCFSVCTGLKQITIPNSVNSLGEGAFYGCSGLTSVSLSDKITFIRTKTFMDCSNLKEIKLPSNITTIQGSAAYLGAFSYCKNLTKILIPDTVSSIGDEAFYYCNKLTIYGNDGQVSKQYAEDNKINFDYIANWDKASSGTDITAPEVTKMVIKYSGISGMFDKTTNTYKVDTGKTIQILVYFSEEIKGKTAPTLKIKCGDGETRTISKGEIAGTYIVYNYTIQNGDSGVITAVSYEGGDITDNAGNKAQLSCKTIYEQQYASYKVYANGTKSNTQGNTNKGTEQTNSDTKTDGTNQNDGQKQQNNTDSKTTTTAGETKQTNTTTKTEETTDDTVKKDSKLPQTGVAFISVLGIIILAVAIISKVKYGKYSDIK